ncbi:hypothetical protein OROGR_000200 [Orobanche gracilis]
MKPIPVPAGEEVAPKLVRLLYFVGAGGINKWNDLQKKSTIRKEQQLNGPSLDSPSSVVHEAVE